MDAIAVNRRNDRIAAWASAIILGASLVLYCGTSSGSVVWLLLGAGVLAPVVGLADEGGRDWVRRRLPGSLVGGVVIWAAFLTLLVAGAVAQHRTSFALLSAWAVYLALPIVIVGARKGASPGVRLLLAAVAIVLPFAVGLVPNVPFSPGSRPPLNFGLVVILDLGLTLLLVYGPETPPSYRLWVSRREGALATAVFAAFFVVALPLGLLIGFIAPGFGVATIGAAVARLLNLFFLVAIPEEVVFRGFLQNGLERLLGNARGLVLTAVLFGLAHIGHAPAPNWSYAALATLAGIGYGWVYQRTRSITAAAVTHVLVDWTWFVLLAGKIT